MIEEIKYWQERKIGENNENELILIKMGRNTETIDKKFKLAETKRKFQNDKWNRMG